MATKKKAASSVVKKERSSLADTADLVNICYYGGYGEGKTTALLLATNLCVGDGRVVVINAEGGIKKKPLSRMGVDLDKIEVFPDRAQKEAHTFEELEDLFWSLKNELEDDPDSVTAIIWDSVTEAQKLLMEPIVAYGVEKAESKGKERSRFEIYKEDWGVNTEQMRQLIRKFRDLPCHFGMSALERRDQDDDGVVVYGPATTPALQGDIGGYCDVICHAYTETYEGEQIFLGHMRKHTKYSAKDRFGMTPKIMVNPSLDRVVAYVNGEIEEEDDVEQNVVTELYKKKDESKKGRRRRRPDPVLGEDDDDEDENED